jgi:hypothetical protein
MLGLLSFASYHCHIGLIIQSSFIFIWFIGRSRRVSLHRVAFAHFTFCSVVFVHIHMRFPLSRVVAITGVVRRYRTWNGQGGMCLVLFAHFFCFFSPSHLGMSVWHLSFPSSFWRKIKNLEAQAGRLEKSLLHLHIEEEKICTMRNPWA